MTSDISKIIRVMLILTGLLVSGDQGYGQTFDPVNPPEDIVIRIYHNWQYNPDAYTLTTLRLQERVAYFDFLGIQETTVIAILPDDQTDQETKKHLKGDINSQIYSWYYQKGLKFTLPHNPLPIPPMPTFSIFDGELIPISGATLKFYWRIADNPKNHLILIHTLVLDDTSTFEFPVSILYHDRLKIIFTHPDYGSALVDSQFNFTPYRKIYIPLVNINSPAYERAVKGVIRGTDNKPVQGVTITCDHIRTLGYGLMTPINGVTCHAVSNENGFFSLYLPIDKHDDLEYLIPPKSAYQLKIETPKEYLKWTQKRSFANDVAHVIQLSTRISPDTTTRLRKFKFIDENGTITDPELLKKIYVYKMHDTTKSNQRTRLDEWAQADNFPHGTYRAFLYKKYEFEDVIINADTLDVVVFKAKPPLIYSGRVIDAHSNLPLPGAFVIAMTGGASESNLAHITPQQWAVLHSLPASLGVNNPAFEPIKSNYGFSKITRTDQYGNYQFTSRPGDEVYGYIAFEEFYTGHMRRKFDIKTLPPPTLKSRIYSYFPPPKSVSLFWFPTHPISQFHPIG
ncbi:MAG: hypothetical protein GY869_20915 [Planctomycetes bacterium]|nr:hypothetical protein [Planctomycetota bacterium]